MAVTTVADLRRTLGDAQRMIDETQDDSDLTTKALPQMILFHQLALERAADLLERLESDLRRLQS